MEKIIKELKEILDKALKQDENWNNYFEEQVMSLEEVVSDFSARMAQYESTDWASENNTMLQEAKWESDNER